MIYKKHILLGDIIIILVVLLVSFILPVFNLFHDESLERFTVKTDIESVSYPLNINTEILVNSNGYELTLEVADGSVTVSDSNCPDLTCVRMGKIQKNGEVIVCLPAKTIIAIDDTAIRSDVDAEAG